MADNQRTLELKILADIEAARNQLEGLVGILGKTAGEVDAKLGKIEDAFDRSSKGISTSTLALASTIGNVLGNAISQIPGALLSMTQSAIESAGSIKNVAATLGISTDALQDFRLAAQQSGVETAKADRALEKFQTTTGKAADGNKAASAAFKAVGVDIADAQGNLKPFETLLGDVADGLVKLPDPARQTAAAVALFGSAGNDLLPFLTTGSKGINDLAAANEQLGMKLTPDTIDKLDQLGNKADAVKTVFTSQMAAAIAENANAIVALGDAMARAGNVAASSFSDIVNFYRGFKNLSGDRTLSGKVAFGKALLTGDDEYIIDAGKRATFIDGVMSQNGNLGANGLPGFTGARRAPPPSGGAVVPPPAKTTRAKATKAPYDLRGNVDKLLDSPAQLSKEFSSVSSDATNTIANLDGSARTLGNTLSKAFDKSKLDDFAKSLPNLSAEMDQAHLAGQQFVQDFSFGLASILTQSGELGDKLVSVFANIGASMLQSGILNFLSGGAQGTSFGTLFKGVGSIFGGARAEGGPVTGGRAYLVGEQGPEIVVPGMSGSVIPNHALRAGRAAGGGGSTFQSFDLRGAVVTEKLYADMMSYSQRAAQAGAAAGRALASGDRARSARRRL